MQKISKQAFIEVLWLIASLGLTLLLSLLLFGKNILNDTVGVHLYNTHFVIAPLHILLPGFFLVTFIVYFIKELRNSFQRTLPNQVLLLVGFSLIIALTFLIRTFSQSFTGGWTLYPPLSASGPNKPSELPQIAATKFITNLFTVIQILALAILLFVAFRWGTQKRDKE
ncbi:MAG: hypothetical protein QM731_06360 [Chitinophagaceae bacterium]